MTRHRAHTVWTEQAVRTLRLFFADTPTAIVAQILGLSIYTVNNQAYRLGLRKSEYYLGKPEACRLRRSGDDHPGKATQFQPGLVPWNKGKHIPTVGRMAETQFKPGQMPHTWRPIGTDRLSKEGYLQVKLADTGVTRRDYVAIHHLVWELHRGPIPAGHAICFKDGDRTRIVIENLECISRRALMARNTVQNLPKELALLVQLRGALKRKINRRVKEHERTAQE